MVQLNLDLVPLVGYCFHTSCPTLYMTHILDVFTELMAQETLSHQSFGIVIAVISTYSTAICAIDVQPLLPVERAINYGFISLVKSIFHACGRLPIHRKV